MLDRSSLGGPIPTDGLQYYPSSTFLGPSRHPAFPGLATCLPFPSTPSHCPLSVHPPFPRPSLPPPTPPQRLAVRQCLITNST